jgi:hypothetical protein
VIHPQVAAECRALHPYPDANGAALSGDRRQITMRRGGLVATLPRSVLFNALTLLRDAINSPRAEDTATNFNQLCDMTFNLCATVSNFWGKK